MDCYVGNEDYMNIVTLTDKFAFCMADDENSFEGIYKNLNISEDNYERMVEISKSKNRNKLLKIINEIHDNIKNKNILNDVFFGEKISESRKQDKSYISLRLIEFFMNREPILE